MQNLITKELKQLLKDKEKIREALFCIRDNRKIYCDNIHFFIYLDGVLDEPIKFKIGNPDNCLRISIKMDGKTNFTWITKTWRKTIWDISQDLFSLSTLVTVSEKIMNFTIEFVIKPVAHDRIKKIFARYGIASNN